MSPETQSTKRPLGSVRRSLVITEYLGQEISNIYGDGFGYGLVICLVVWFSSLV